MNDDALSIFDKPVYLFSPYRNDVAFYGEGVKHVPNYCLYGCANSDDDQVWFELNTKDRTIKCRMKDGDEFEPLFTNIEQDDSIRYKLAVSISTVGDGVSIIRK